MLTAEHLCKLIEDARTLLPAEGNAPLSRELSGRLLRDLTPYAGNMVVDSFLRDVCGQTAEAPDLRRSREACYAADELILGIFSASYNRALGLDALAYRTLQPDSETARRFPCPNVRAVHVRACTSGFAAESCVALFPENFVTRAPVEPAYPSFYFIDRFVTRFFEKTRPLVKEFVRPGDLPEIEESDRSLISAACIAWVHLHERIHRLGYLPIPEHLDKKSTRSLAALEELRVDTVALIECLKLADSGLGQFEFYAGFILAERLLRYPAESSPQDSYDSRATQVLHTFLAGRGALEVCGFRLSIRRERLLGALQELATVINKMECRIVRDADSRARVDQSRLGLVRRYGGYQPDQGFVYLPFYRRVREAARPE
jgi:hypothetical protein